MTDTAISMEKGKRLCLIAMSALCGILFVSFHVAEAQNSQTPFPKPETVPAPLLVQGLPDFTALIEATSPSVVNIRTMTRMSQGAQSPFGNVPPEMRDFFEYFFDSPEFGHTLPVPQGQEPLLRPSGVASGFIISSDGYIMTNAHVVENADDIIVVLPNSTHEYHARVVGSDKRTDVALLQIEGVSNLPVVRIGDANALKVGEWVVAIGSPFGLDNTVTAGIISAKQRDTGDYVNFIQTDVAINPGNSGGPLINMRGEVVGINSQIYSRSGGFMGISFSIPIDEAMTVAEQLRTQGFVERGRIGITISPISAELAQTIGVGDEAHGALVHSVEENGSAQRAGIQAGDIIIQVNSHEITSPKELQRYIGNIKPDSEINVRVFRRGEWKEFTVKVDAVGDENMAIRSAQQSEPLNNMQDVAVLGVRVADLNSEEKITLGLNAGVVIRQTNPYARRVGLREGDVILAVGNVEIRSVSALQAMADSFKDESSIALQIRRGNGVAYIVMQPIH